MSNALTPLHEIHSTGLRDDAHGRYAALIYASLEADRQDALRKIARLEEQLTELREQLASIARGTR